ncbi:type VI secretion system protein TssA [Pseudomonas sp. DWP3-1-2]|uniref:type VI secretion system protein TssA n=1 Tax=Pseudomonas sp. DWP3-1-2 TaxID=2804645 RepID=UPI003CF5627B
MAPINAARYLKIAQTPISKGDYAGLDARYSPEYEALEVELAKALPLHENGKVDWQKVQEHSEVILTTLSKDLRVVCWLSWALYQLQSFTGLVAGFGMLCHFCTHHWAQIHPGKSRTRSAAISWLIMRLEKVLDSNVPVKDQLELFRQLVKLLEELDAVLTLHLKADSPLILPLRRRLASMVQRASENRPEPGPVEAAIAQVKQTATQWFAGDSVIENEKDAQKAVREQQENGLALCAWWLRQKATDPRALRLNRTLTWLLVTSVPQQNAARVTDLRAPPADTLKSYRNLFEQGQYADLLVQLEASTARSPFWFDGQRMVWECLDALDAEGAKQELEIHFALFLQRLPGIVELRFHDGVEFANAETREWITAHVIPRLQPVSTPRKVRDSEVSPPWQLALEKAIPILRKGGLKAAVQEMRPGLQSAQGGRERFFWQLSLARLCHKAKKYDLAKAQLETLDQQLQQSGLHLWEPDLALDVLHLLHSCYGLLPQGHEVRERRDEIYRRLCHLDLEVVLE